ncbi:MAG: alkylhydroperoxidase domain protein [Lautropia sp.]
MTSSTDAEIVSDAINGGDRPPPHAARRPAVFSRSEHDWRPWLEPLPEAGLSERQQAALIDRSRAKSAYFRLLARDPDVLEARTRVDRDIFLNGRGGLPRAERELAAAATSRVNGCIYCAGIHGRFAAQLSQGAIEIDRLLTDGVDADLGPRWNAIVAAARALSATPPAFDAGHVRALRAAGFETEEILDVIQSAAFFNWANRLMLSLGEPYLRN